MAETTARLCMINQLPIKILLVAQTMVTPLLVQLQLFTLELNIEHKQTKTRGITPNRILTEASYFKNLCIFLCTFIPCLCDPPI